MGDVGSREPQYSFCSFDECDASGDCIAGRCVPVGADDNGCEGWAECVTGTETEYGIAAVGQADLNPVLSSSLLISSYAGSLRRIRWDYEQESPMRDARGFEPVQMREPPEEELAIDLRKKTIELASLEPGRPLITIPRDEIERITAENLPAAAAEELSSQSMMLRDAVTQLRRLVGGAALIHLGPDEFPVESGVTIIGARYPLPLLAVRAGERFSVFGHLSAAPYGWELVLRP